MKTTAPLKNLLRDEAIPALTATRPYFSMVELRAWLTRRRIPWSATTLNSYLHAFTNNGTVYDAGRGWYSTLAKRIELDRSHIAPVLGLIEEAFPLLKFAGWSTQQINPWMHHLLGKFVTFVYVEKEGVGAVWELLKEKGYDVYRNPTKREILRTFAVRDNTVVVWVGGLSQAPLDGHFAAPEKVLVDLVVEAARLPLMDASDLADVFTGVLTAGRMDIPSLLNYSIRKRQNKKIIKYINQLTSQK